MERLGNLLKSIDGKGYKAYKEISGKYKIKDLELEILNVQGDPFASPTMFEFSIKVRKVTDNLELLETKIKKTAFEDYLLRELYENLEKDGYIGEIFLLKPQDEIIKRTAISIKGEKLFIKYYLNLPAKGRNVLGNEAFEKIDKFSKKIYEYLLGFNVEKAKRQIKLFENIENLREKLKTEKVKVFIANGTIIKKEDKEIRIDSPPTLEREFVLENGFSFNENFEISYLKDSSNSLNIQEIANSNDFQKHSNKFSLGYLKDTIWIKVDLKNKSSKEDFILSLNEHFYEKANMHYFDKSENLWKTLKNGVFTPIKERNIETSKLAFNFKIQQNSSQTIFIELKAKYPYFGNIAVYSKDYFFASRILNIDSFFIAAFIPRYKLIKNTKIIEIMFIVKVIGI